jgi:hypothetical protein
MNRNMFFFKKINPISHYSEIELFEIRKFHLMLVKMKKKRPNFNVKKVLDLVYPNNNIDLR